MKVLFWIVFLFVFLILFKLFYRMSLIFSQFVLFRQKDLRKRYGENSYAVITGASRGQGREFARQLAGSGMNLILIGSNGCHKVRSSIRKDFPGIDVVVLQTDFSNAFEPDYFDEMEALFDEYDVSILVNNVGYRTGWMEYEKMPPDEIKKCLAVCTMTQCRMMQMALKKFKQRSSNRCAIINITSQCIHPTDVLAMTPEISLPYLSVYEAAKAFDYYHSNSIHKEIKERFEHIDYLTVTPGAVLTETTEPMLRNTAFCVSDTVFVSNILKCLGNRNGVVCGSFGHAMSGILINFCPFIKESILLQTSKTIAKTQQERIENYSS